MNAQNQLARAWSSTFRSSHFKGIGLKTAQKIVDTYGDNTIDEILQHPEKLEGISGLSAKNREAFRLYSPPQLRNRDGFGQTCQLRHSQQTSLSDSRLLQGRKTLDVVENYPYQLVEDIKGLSFTIADQLAEELGIESQAPERFRAGLVHSLFRPVWKQGTPMLKHGIC